ncbi:hypothetical protein [Priestia sp. AB]|uniref:hypothetical protein n=1 Tax=Priestia sp. AB TaxID=3020890 RepID=UPI00232F522D|nr:hypothetical protein [Priestia sp. AB]MDC0706245.1 hypothetical protein [Priestia sp. AB]
MSKSAKLIKKIFFKYYKENDEIVKFERDDFIKASQEMNTSPPKNIGGVIYQYRYTSPLPKEILNTCKAGENWIIEGDGHAKYKFMKVPISPQIMPTLDYPEIQIYDATPGIIKKFALSDEQALLAIVRYNRLVDIFTGITTYSLQNHLRTRVDKIGQIEIDEVYVGVNSEGEEYILPIQAKGGKDRIGIVQINQDIEFCKTRFPHLNCKALAVQFKYNENVVVMFELGVVNYQLKVVKEKHYRLI